MSRRLPALKPREVIRALERAGFFVARTSGSHYPEKPPAHAVTVPFHTRDPSRSTVASIIKQAGMTPEKFLELL